MRDLDKSLELPPHERHDVDDEHVVHKHGQHAGHSTAMFKDRFWLTLALSVPVVYFSPMFGHLLGYTPPQFPGSSWIPPVLGTVIFLYGGQPFLHGGLNELKARRPGMMLLIGMAITVAFIASWVTSLGIGGFDLVGTRPACGHHAPGPLAGDAGPRLRAGCP
jgi:Cu2+-exporting ATPase